MVRPIVLVIAACSLVATAPVLAQDAPAPAQDVVRFGGGDRLTGEVKGLERGKLSFDTDATGTIGIEWENVESISSNQYFEVWTAAGVRHFGTLSEGGEVGVVSVTSPSGVVALAMTDVVAISEIEQTFVESFDLNVRAGYSFSKASEISQLSSGLDLTRRSERKYFTLALDADSSDSAGGEEQSNRAFADARYYYLLPDRWLAGGFATLESNDELELDLRKSIGGLGGRIMRQSNSNRIQITGGLVLTEEKASAPLESRTDSTFEGLFGADLEWFRFDTPELDITMRFELYPNLEESGRYRTSFDTDFRWEIINDLFWALTVYHRYENDPLAEGSGTDYGVTTSLGWEF
jgi:hypothetical protein